MDATGLADGPTAGPGERLGVGPEHLLQIHGLDNAPLGAILARAARSLRRSAVAPASVVLAPDRLVGLLFFENSTRTRLSFAAAAHGLGAGVLDLNAGVSSVSKGESFIDTAYTLDAMGARAMVVRSRDAGVPHQIARALGSIGSRAMVINAGDGRHEHPTQALIDALALGERLGRLTVNAPDHAPAGAMPRDVLDLSGLRIAIVGDLMNSRVARSGAHLLTRLGARVVGCGPRALAPDAFGTAMGIPIERDFDALAGEVDAVLMLRVQFERHAELTHPGAPAQPTAPATSASASGAAGAKIAIWSDQTPAQPGGSVDRAAFRAGYALTTERLARFDAALGRETIVMHPGPMNRGLEIDGPCADGPNSIIRRQVAVGVAVRTALLARAFGADESP